MSSSKYSSDEFTKEDFENISNSIEQVEWVYENCSKKYQMLNSMI